MINNRQNGRRRGRGGQRPPGVTGRSDGNRQDTRQRGNAAQLLEKYKALARDSQQAGDRVQTEYFLQFAEHYFRVLGEGQARFDEQRRARGEDLDDGYDGDGMDGDEGEDGDQQFSQQQDRPLQQDRPQRQEQPRRQYEDRPERPPQQQQQRADRYERNDRPQRDERPQPRDDRPREDRPREDRPQPREDRPQRGERSEVPAAERPARVARPRVRRDRDEEAGEQRIDLAVIPPAIGAVEQTGPEAETEDPVPRRRIRRARPEGDAEVAPAA